MSVCVFPIKFCVAQRDTSNKTASHCLLCHNYNIAHATKESLKGCKSYPHKTFTS